MARIRVREGSPVWWLIRIIGAALFVYGLYWTYSLYILSV